MRENLACRLVRPLIAEMGMMEGRSLVKRLWDEGLLDIRELERRAIRGEVDRRVRSGEGRCRAMERVAAEYCCSYEKVREIVYNKRER